MGAYSCFFVAVAGPVALAALMRGKNGFRPILEMLNDSFGVQFVARHLGKYPVDVEPCRLATVGEVYGLTPPPLLRLPL
jgi:hypothetical protein